jgi:hypothetical protein
MPVITPSITDDLRSVIPAPAPWGSQELAATLL